MKKSYESLETDLNGFYNVEFICKESWTLKRWLDLTAAFFSKFNFLEVRMLSPCPAVVPSLANPAGIRPSIQLKPAEDYLIKIKC